MSDIVKKQKELVVLAIERVNELSKVGSMLFPKNYSAETAIRSAGLILADLKDMSGNLVLPKAKQESVVNSLMKMVTLGLNPQRHCDFILHGDKLTCRENNKGKMMIAKRDGGVKDVFTKTIFKGSEDSFKYEITENGNCKIISHKEKLSDRNTPVIGAYATVVFSDGRDSRTILMTIEEIKKSWAQRSQNKAKSDEEKLSSTHMNFTAEMAEKTVSNRILKPILNSLDDRSLFTHDEPEIDKSEADIRQEIKETEYTEFEEIKEKPENSDKKQPEPVQEVQPEEEDPF